MAQQKVEVNIDLKKAVDEFLNLVGQKSRPWRGIATPDELNKWLQRKGVEFKPHELGPVLTELLKEGKWAIHIFPRRRGFLIRRDRVEVALLADRRNFT